MWAVKSFVLFGKLRGDKAVSRVGKKIILVPEKVQVVTNENTLVFKGPKGQMEFHVPKGITHHFDGKELTFTRSDDEKHVRALHGLSRALSASMIHGVNEGFTKKMSVEGVGYKVELRGSNLLLTMGFSHPILFIPPPGIAFAVTSPTVWTVSGIDKQLVGQVAAKIHKIRPPEPYKGKGIRYEGEFILRKAGKSGSK